MSSLKFRDHNSVIACQVCKYTQEVGMRSNDFFQEVEHTQVPWREYKLHVPVFYPDIHMMTVSYLAPTQNLLAMLPSTRLKPYRVTPWHSILSISAYEYRETDLGPYNEVSVGIPVTIDKSSPLFTGILRSLPIPAYSYTHHLPVTTEIARVVGAEFAGYPKFVADIDFIDDGGWVTCTLCDSGQNILTMKGRKLDTGPVSRYRAHPLTYRNDYILRSEMTISERDMGMSKSGDDLQLELGSHPIAEELRTLPLGRMLFYGYCPKAQGILTPVIESFTDTAS